MFISTEDFKVVASEASLKVITQADPDNVENAIAEAIEEVAGYLRPRYDCGKIFAAEGNDRNRQLVMYTADIALYNMAASTSGRMAGGRASWKDRARPAWEYRRTRQRHGSGRRAHLRQGSRQPLLVTHTTINSF